DNSRAAAKSGRGASMLEEFRFASACAILPFLVFVHQNCRKAAFAGRRAVRDRNNLGRRLIFLEVAHSIAPSSLPIEFHAFATCNARPIVDELRRLGLYGVRWKS